MLKLPTCLLIICAAALMPFKAAGQETSVVFHPDQDSADRAMSLGDSRQLQELLNAASDPVRRELVAAYKSRTDLKLEDSNQHADRCAQLALKDLPTHYRSSVRCKVLRAGNALVDGDYPTWSMSISLAFDDAGAQIRSLLHGAVPGKYTDDVKLFLPDTVSLPKLPWPAPVFTRAASGSHVERATSPHAEKSSSVIPEPFFAKVKVNGHEALFAIDTGASATVIGGETARLLGLESSKSAGSAIYNLVLLGQQVQTSFVRIDTIEVGGFSVSGATVLMTEDPNVLNVIGLDLIRKMGGLRFSSKRLTFVDASECQGTLTLASDPVATNKAIIARVDVGGSSQTPVDIDTGNSAFLTAYSGAALPPGTQWTVNGVAGVVEASASPHPLGAKYNLGTAILDRFDLVVDVEKGRFCLSSRSMNH